MRQIYTSPRNANIERVVTLMTENGIADQTRARQVLRDAGLEPATRFADELAAARSVGDTGRHKRASTRVKLIVFALIAGVIALIALTQISR